MGYCYLNVRINSANDACISCENFVKFGPVTPELTELICERQVRQGQKNWRISLNISGYNGLIFAVFLPYESTLRADDGSVTYFQIYQETLPWKPNYRNEGKLILRTFFAHVPDGCTVLVRYYLLGGDTVAPSGLYARLCHTFLVSDLY